MPHYQTHGVDGKRGGVKKYTTRLPSGSRVFFGVFPSQMQALFAIVAMPPVKNVVENNGGTSWITEGVIGRIRRLKDTGDF